jgi:hypothetical protein
MRLRPWIALAASAAAAAVLSGDAVGAYSLLGPTWPQSFMPYYVNPANLDRPVSAIEPAIRVGADAWRQQSGASFQFAFAGLTAQTINTNDGINMVLFRNASSGSALATTYSWFSGTRIIDADIVFWDAGYQFVTGTSGCSEGFYIEDVATHEFGHALGLGHSTVAGATMYPSISTCSQQSRLLDADDIAAVRALYPPTAVPPAPPVGLRLVRPGG